MKTPLPGPYDPDEDIDASPTPWSMEMWWAQRRQYGPLIAALRSGAPIDGDDREVREFLADVLAGKVKRPKGSPPQTLPRHLRGWMYTHVKMRMSQLQRTLSFEDALDQLATERPIKDAKIKAGTLKNWLRRSKQKRKKSAALNSELGVGDTTRQK